MWCKPNFIMRKKTKMTTEYALFQVTSEFTAFKNSMEFIKQSEDFYIFAFYIIAPVNIILLPSMHFQVQDVGKGFFPSMTSEEELNPVNFSLYHFILLARLFAHSRCTVICEVITQQSGLEKPGSFTKLNTLGKSILLQPFPLFISTLAYSLPPRQALPGSFGYRTSPDPVLHWGRGGQRPNHPRHAGSGSPGAGITSASSLSIAG